MGEPRAKADGKPLANIERIEQDALDVFDRLVNRKSDTDVLSRECHKLIGGVDWVSFEKIMGPIERERKNNLLAGNGPDHLHECFGIDGRARVNVVIKKSEYAVASTGLTANMADPRFEFGITVIVSSPCGQPMEPDINEIGGDGQVHRHGTGTYRYKSCAMPSQDCDYILGQPGKVSKLDRIIVGFREPRQKAIEAREILC